MTCLHLTQSGGYGPQNWVCICIGMQASIVIIKSDGCICADYTLNYYASRRSRNSDTVKLTVCTWAEPDHAAAGGRASSLDSKRLQSEYTH